MSDDASLERLLEAALESRRAQHLERRRRVITPIDAVHVEIDGRRLVNFCSNNYLGLTHHPKVIEAVATATRAAGAGAAASGLISGYTSGHASAEAALAAWKGAEAAVLPPSGYQANHAAVQTIVGSAEVAGTRVRFLLDKLAHASLIDAVRGSGASFRIFPHNDLAKLERLLAERDSEEMQVVVTESVFSMDGDAAPLAELADLKRRHPFVLLLDEAHGSGVYGPNGAGLAAELRLTDAVDVFVVTLSKAMGLVGGAVCSSRSFCDALLNFGRAYVYSTAVPPAIAVGCEASLRVMRDEPERQRRVRELARRVREAVGMNGDCPIVPIGLQDEPAALRAAANLEERGLLVLAVRPPTVPKATSRLRVTLSCEHSDDEVAVLIDAIRQLKRVE